MNVVYLEIDDVLGFYADLFGLSVEQAADHLRDRNRPEAALARPSQHAYYMDADLAQQAAALAHGIAEGQPFVDGNDARVPARNRISSERIPGRARRLDPRS